jgi:hypothetical protein
MLRNFAHTTTLATLALFAASGAALAQTGGGGGSMSFGGGSGGGGGGGGSSGLGGGGGSGTSSSGFFSGSSGGSFGGGGSSGSGFFGSGSGTGSGLGGSSSFSGGGGFGTGSGTGLGSTTTGVNRADPFYSYFNNPMGFGVPKTGTSSSALGSNGSITPSKSSVTFGAPLYGTALTTSTGAGGRSIGAAGAATGTTGKMGGYPPAMGAATPLSKAPVYSIVVGFPTRPPAPAQVQSNLAGVLARSSTLGNDRRIAIATDGETVVLRGTVGNEHDKRLAEAMARLTPGVHDVRNELQIQPGNSTP